MKTILFNPFKKYSEKIILAIGISGTIIGSYLAYLFLARFDGVLDIHFVNEINIWHPFKDNLINIISLATTLLIASKYINKKSRIIDIIAATILARIPFYFLPFFNSNDYITNSTEKITSIIKPEQLTELSFGEISGLLVFAFFSLLALIWFISLLFNGFKVASNAKGKLPIVLFVAAVLLAEIISKFLIVNLNAV